MTAGAGGGPRTVPAGRLPAAVSARGVEVAETFTVPIGERQESGGVWFRGQRLARSAHEGVRLGIVVKSERMT